MWIWGTARVSPFPVHHCGSMSPIVNYLWHRPPSKDVVSCPLQDRSGGPSVSAAHGSLAAVYSQVAAPMACRFLGVREVASASVCVVLILT